MDNANEGGNCRDTIASILWEKKNNYNETNTKSVQRCVKLYKVKISSANFKKLTHT